jgi:predicted DNA binding CopG/RHH family protein
MKSIKHIPKFKNEDEEAKFWDTHSVTDYLHELKEVHNVKFPKPRKRLVSMRLDYNQINSLKQVAASKGIGYLTLIRLWIYERLSKERRVAHAHHS